MDDDPAFARLWLSELGAHVPEAHGGVAPAPRLRGYGLDHSPGDRAHKHGRALDGEQRRARQFRARSDPPGGRA